MRQQAQASLYFCRRGSRVRWQNPLPRSDSKRLWPGAKIDIVVGVTPFLACWCWRKFEAAKFLVLQGANLNYQDQKGKTALHYGVEKEFDPALLKWLVQRGASPDIEDRSGVSPRLKASRKRDTRFFEALA